MKNIIKFILILIIFTYSCKLEETNENPNDVLNAPVTVLLPQAQNYMANSLMNENSATVGIFLQYFKAQSNSNYSPYEEYVADNGFYINDMWYDYYANAMVLINDIMNKSEAAGAYHYTGISQIMMAWAIGTVTDCWGDVPYSDAFMGSENLKPTFDNQKDIYNKIFQLLNDGIENLDKESTLDPTEYDVIYGGNLTLWKKAAYSLIARYSLHLTKRSSDLAFDPLQQALSAIPNAFDVNDQPMAYLYGFNDSDVNPYTKGKNNTELSINDTFKNLTNNHPSRDGLIKTQLGSADTGPYLSNNNTKAYFMTPYELKFIEAEVRLRINTSDPLIETALKEGIESFLTEVAKFDSQLTNDSITSYVSRISLTGDFDSDLETIITHKYISLYGQVEQWSDFRRTGYPTLIPNPNGQSPQNANGEIPRRYPYPLNEIELNGGNVPSAGVNMQARVWWDSE